MRTFKLPTGKLPAGKLLSGVTLASGIAMAGVAPAAEPAVWQGDLFITSVTSTCTALGISAVGEFDRTVYRPNIAPPPAGQSQEALLLVSTRSAFLLEATGKTLRGSAKATGTAVGSHATLGEGATTVKLAITPAKITATTPVVQISGTLNNLFDVPGCNVGVIGALGLRHD